MLSLKVIWPKSQHQDQNIALLSFSLFLLKFNFSLAQTAQGQTDSSVFMINDFDSKHTLELRYKNVTAKILMEAFVIIILSQIKDAWLLLGFGLRTMRASVRKIWYFIGGSGSWEGKRHVLAGLSEIFSISCKLNCIHCTVLYHSFHAWFLLYGLA